MPHIKARDPSSGPATGEGAMMNCPPEIAEILVDLIRTALLTIRFKGWKGDSAGCAAEAEHADNLPDLLRDFSVGKLRYYWEVERPAFMRQVGNLDLEQYQHLWDRLSAHVNKTSANSAH
jgi:hypothetical protein